MTNMSWLKRLSKYAGAHAPEILIGVGVASGIGAVVTAAFATVKAAKIIEQRKAEKEALTKKEIVAAVWKNYIPTVGAVILSVGCIVAANTVSRKRSAALAAYALSETAFSAYKQSVADEFGVEKERDISDKAVQKRIENTPVNNTEVINVGIGDVLVYDELAGRYFRSDKNRIIGAVNELNRMILQDDTATLNDFYDLVGLNFTELGYLMGWTSSQGSVNVTFSSHLTADGEPCLSYSLTAPKYLDDIPF